MIRRLMVVFLLALPLTGSAFAQTDAPPVSPALIDQLENIEDTVNEVRGLDTLEPLNRVFPTRETVSEFLMTSVEEQLTPELVEESMAFYVAFDFVEPNIDLVGVYLELLEDQIGGYYDPEAQTLNTILISGGELGDSLPVLEQIIYAHEYVHALQDQHFGLEEIGFDNENISDIPVDEVLALQALIEGDATLVMNLYTEALVSRNPLAAVGMIGSTLASGSLTLPEGVPPILTRELMFPYNAGATFVTALVQEGGWDAVDAAFEQIPTSTEQILHPQKYIDGEAPVTVTLGETDAVLGEGWTVASEDTLGEFYLRAYLDTQLEVSESVPAAAGWGGDAYRIYEHDETGELAWVLRLAWDTATDADEFASAYTAFGDARFGSTAAESCWVSSAETLCFTEAANGDSVITFAPLEDTARALMGAQ